MAIERTDVVDAIGVDRDTGAVVLTLVDGLDWEDEVKHLDVLRGKLQSYLKFIESGELLESYPNGRGRDVRIEVVFRCEPTEAARGLLQCEKEVAAGLSVALAWRVQSG